MKRRGNLIHKIAEFENLQLAFYKFKSNYSLAKIEKIVKRSNIQTYSIKKCSGFHLLFHFALLFKHILLPSLAKFTKFSNRKLLHRQFEDCRLSKHQRCFQIFPTARSYFFRQIKRINL